VCHAAATLTAAAGTEALAAFTVPIIGMMAA